MEEESGFINSDSDNVSGSDLSDNLHDFRQLYVSSKGFARVFTARKGGRLYAVKTLRSEFSADRIARAALRKEYDAAYPVDSPFVVRTLDFISLPGFGDAIVMEYCPGNTLADYISAGEPLTENDIAAIAAGIVRGLDDIHAAGVIHRDVKPSNVIYNPATRSVRIIDFGFADSRQFYLLHQAAGTAGYAPPEVGNDDYEASIRDDSHAAAMTLSALMPLCPQRCRRNLHALTERLLRGEEVDASQVRSFMLGGGDRRMRKAIVSVIGVAVAIALVTVLYFWIMKVPAGRERAENHALTSAKDSTFNLQKETGNADPAGMAVMAEPREDNKSAAVARSEGRDVDETSVPASGVPVQVPDDEKTPNEYGVSHSEAKYMALFKKSDFDHYVVQATDNILSEWTVVYHNGSESEEVREAARRGYYSLEEVYRIVEGKLDKRFGEYDHRRAKGLVKERMRLWHEGYSPLGTPQRPVKHGNQ